MKEEKTSRDVALNVPPNVPVHFQCWCEKKILELIVITNLQCIYKVVRSRCNWTCVLPDTNSWTITKVRDRENTLSHRKQPKPVENDSPRPVMLTVRWACWKINPVDHGKHRYLSYYLQKRYTQTGNDQARFNQADLRWKRRTQIHSPIQVCCPQMWHLSNQFLPCYILPAPTWKCAATWKRQRNINYGQKLQKRTQNIVLRKLCIWYEPNVACNSVSS